jgi:hypothetical protein
MQRAYSRESAGFDDLHEPDAYGALLLLAVAEVQLD